MFYEPKKSDMAITYELVVQNHWPISRTIARLPLAQVPTAQPHWIEARLNDMIFSPVAPYRGSRFEIDVTIATRVYLRAEISERTLEQLIRNKEEDPRWNMQVAQPPIRNMKCGMATRGGWPYHAFLTVDAKKGEKGGVLVKDVVEGCLREHRLAGMTRRNGDAIVGHLEPHSDKTICDREVLFTRSAGEGIFEAPTSEDAAKKAGEEKGAA